MAGLAWGTQDITVLRATEGPRDAEGRRTTVFEQAESVRGSVHERTTRELAGTGQSWEQVSEWRALLPAGTVITEKDALVDQDGVRYRVMTAVPRRGPGGVVHHVSCRVMRVEQ